MTPKRMMDGIFWALVAGLVVFPLVRSGLYQLMPRFHMQPKVPLLVMGGAFALVAWAAFFLGRLSGMFRVAAVAAAGLSGLTMFSRYLWKVEGMEVVWRHGPLVLDGVLMVSLLLGTARMCGRRGEVELARMAGKRVLVCYLFLLVIWVGHSMPYFPGRDWRIAMANLPLLARCAGYTLVALTVQSARRRLYPD